MSSVNTTPDTSIILTEPVADTVQQRRPVRSYVIRSGRLTASQDHALHHFWRHFGLEADAGILDPVATFGRKAPLIMEIGFGMGDSLLQMAIANPDRDFIGVEVHRPGVGRLLHEIAAHDLSNLRIYSHDAKDILAHCIADEALDTLQIFFPDPWHKKRHNKRRLIQPDFMEQVRHKLKPGGRVHMATDWVPYAEHMMSVMSSAPGYRNASRPNQYSPSGERPITKFEKRGERLGHVVNDLIFVRDE